MRGVSVSCQNSCRAIGEILFEDGLGFSERRSRLKNDPRPYIIVHFNDALEPQAVGTNDPYDHLSDQLGDAGQLDRAPDYAYFQQYLKQLRYWNGEGWQAEPVMEWP